MSSRELLELLEFMPEDSEYRRARDGYPYAVEREWTRGEYLAARHVAETAASRGGAFDPTGLVSPVERAIEAMRANGTWPPKWWSTGAREAAIKADREAGRPETPAVAEPVKRQRVSSLIANQLRRKQGS